jgi:hypothetical protein
MADYKIDNQGNIIHTTSGEVIPRNPTSLPYMAFQSWACAGGVPDMDDGSVGESEGETLAEENALSEPDEPTPTIVTSTLPPDPKADFTVEPAPEPAAQ